MNLEKIVDYMMQNIRQFKEMNEIDMSMFTKKQTKEIYSEIGEKCYENNDFDGAIRFLNLGEQWGRLLEIGTKLFKSEDPNQKAEAKRFFYVVSLNHVMPKDLAIEFADYIMIGDISHYYLARKPLERAGAVEKAEEIARKLFNQGEFDKGRNFFSITGKKLPEKELLEYANVAMYHKKWREVIDFYEYGSIPMNNAVAMIIAEETKFEYPFERLVKYMKKTNTDFIFCFKLSDNLSIISFSSLIEKSSTLAKE